MIKKFRAKKTSVSNSRHSKYSQTWRMRNLTTEGKITVFKTLALSEVVYFALLTVVPNHIIDELIKSQTNLIW